MLRLENVHAGYGRVEVLRGIDMTVPAGSVVALLGANGAGKTTTLKLIAGLLRPTSGEVHYDGCRVDTWRPHRRARAGVCLIPEGRGIFPRLTVRENLAMFAGAGGAGRAVEQAVTAFPVLGERLHQLAGTLSGGQQQMVAVSRALVSDAGIVLADELSLGLAPLVVDEIFVALDKVRAEGRSLVVVEQYVDRVLAVADYVYILQKGKIAFVGEPAQFGDEMFDHYLGGVA